MSAPEPFDPYYRWLGIAPQEQPPHHYRLLGIRLFENSPDVIESAADRQMAFLRTFQTGAHAAQSQKLLNEVASAKLCLLNAGKRAAYDAWLYQALGLGQAAVPPAVPAPPAVVAPPATGPTAPGVSEFNAAVEQMVDLAASDALAASRSQRGRSSGSGPLMGVAGAIIGAMVLLIVYLNSVNPPPPKSVAEPPVPRDPASEAVEKPPAKVSPGPKSPDKDAKQDASKSSASGAAPVDPAGKKPRPPIKAVLDPVGMAPDPDKGPEPDDPSMADLRPEAAPEPPAEMDQAPASSQPKLSVPSQTEQEKAREEVDEVYGVELKRAKTPAERRALAIKLLEQAKESRDAPAARFVLLTMARDMAAEVADGLTALDAVDELAAGYEVQGLPMKADLLERFQRAARSSDQFLAIADQAKGLVGQAVAEEDFASAERLAQVALGATRSARRGPTKPLVALQAAVKEMAAAKIEATAAETTLQQKPHDAEANFRAGRYYALMLGDWKRGLSYLAKGTDEALKPLAQQELAQRPSDADAQFKLGDAWREAAKERSGREQESLLLHAKTWYQRAQEQTTGGLLKAKIDQRLEELSSVEAPVPSRSVGAAPRGPIARGAWVELLRAVQIDRDQSGGKWEPTARGLAGSAQGGARVMLPVRVEGSYDLQVEFVREEGEEPVGVVFPFGSTNGVLMLSNSRGQFHGLEMIDGRSVRTSPAKVRPGLLANGQRHVIVLSVRVQNDLGEVRVFLDGKPCLRWAGRQASLRNSAEWSTPDPLRPAIGLWNGRVAFHRAMLRLVAGKASWVE